MMPMVLADLGVSLSGARTLLACDVTHIITAAGFCRHTCWGALSFKPIVLFLLDNCFVSLRTGMGDFATETAGETETVKLLNEVVQTFEPSEFRPSYWQSNCHFQTIFGSGALTTKIFGLPVRPFTTTPERFQTVDNDFFDVEYTDGFDDPRSEKSVIIVHGLESSIQGRQVTSFATAFIKKGFTCCLFSFRGCNGVENSRVGAYHVGFTTDLNQVVSTLHRRFPHKRLYLCGFSLGGNVSLKYLGELGEEAPSRGVYGAAVTCVPFDPAGAQSKMDVGFNRAVYSESFLATLKAKAEREHILYPGYFDIDTIRACDTIGGFDEAYIARIYGFRGKAHYYRSSGSKWWLPKIRVPSIAINARDDPFILESTLPTEQDVGEVAPVRLIYHKHGGHCGFYTTQERMGPVGRETELPRQGWLAEELARAIEHIHETTKSVL